MPHANQARACVCAKLLHRYCTRTCSAHNPGARQYQTKIFRTLLIILFALHIPNLHFALHTSSHLKIYDFFWPHRSSSHLIPAFFISSHLFSHIIKVSSTIFISFEYWSTFLISSKLLLIHLSWSVCQKILIVKEIFLILKKNLRKKKSTHIFKIQLHLDRKVFAT